MVAIISAAISRGISRCAVALDELAGVETAETERHRWKLALHAGEAVVCPTCEQIRLRSQMCAGNCDECEELGRGMTDIGEMAVLGYSRK